MAKLSETDINVLKALGYTNSDTSEIEAAVSKTHYIFLDEMTGKKINITAAQARQFLGNDVFLSGIGRSTFHLSAIRDIDKYKSIRFDYSDSFMNRAEDTRL